MGTNIKGTLNRKNPHCRTCYETANNLYALHDKADAEQKKSLADLLLDIAKIDTLTTENVELLPHHICGNCSRKLKNAYSFVQQAQRVNTRLLANLHAANDSKHLDCLLEAPIDMPTNVNDCLQIKMETSDYGEDSLYTLSTADVSLHKVDSSVVAQEKSEIAKTIHSALKQEEELPVSSVVEQDAQGTSATAHLKIDPITLADTDLSQGDEPEEDQNDTDFNPDNDDSDYHPHQKVVTKSPVRKRRRGRPRLATGLKLNSSPNRDGRHTCDVCHKTFAWQKDLSRHAKSHFAAAEYECEHCERRFIRKDKLNDHMKTHRRKGASGSDDKIAASSKGNKKYSLRASRHPEWSFAERLYTKNPFCLMECKLCGDKYSRTEALRQHMLLHAEPSTILLKMESEVVKELFPQSQQLDEIKANISEDIVEQRFAKYYAVVNEYGYEMGISDSDGNADEVNVAPMYRCELCHEEFARKHQVFAHTKAAHAAGELPHKCNVCKMGFVCKQMYLLHSRTQCRSREKKYQCLKCPGKFMWLENLEGHQCANKFNTPAYKAKLPRSRVLQCGICDKTFMWAKDLNRHKETHEADGSLHDCAICFQRFLKAENLRHHMRQTHAQHKRRLQCRLCEQKCVRLSELHSHMQQHVDGITGVNTAEGYYFKLHFPEGTASRETQLAISIAADFAANNITHFYSAVDESGNELDICDSETDAEEMDNKTACKMKLEEQAKHYACDLCGEVFYRRKRMLLHQQSAHAELASIWPHACSECPKRFVCLALLQQHLQRDCLNVQRKLQCDKCPARFVWQDNLELHTQLKHIDPEQQISRQLANKLQCDQCDKVFIWPKDLTRHRRIHMPDDEKYECPMCDRKFNRKDNMHSHMKVHGVEATTNLKREALRNAANKVTGVDEYMCKRNGCKLIQCMICLSKHSKISDLRTHLRTHQYLVSFAVRTEPIEEISTQLYPDERPMSEEALRKRIIENVATQQLEPFYLITNEFGYELSLDSSETESDSEGEETVATLKQLESSMRRGYTCDLCGISCSRKYKLYKHQQSSHEWNEAPYTCTHCQARFLSEEFLQLHYDKQCKNTRKRFVCRKCPHRFMWKENLKEHLRTKHETDVEKVKKLCEPPRLLECLECNRTFRMQKDLTRHMVTHRSDAFIFKCLWCPRKFYRQQNLYMHIKRHDITMEQLSAAECFIKATNGPNGCKQVCCKVCNVQFNSVAALRVHLLQESATALTSHHDYTSLLNYSITNELGFELQLGDSETEDEGGVCRSYTCEECRLTCKRKYELAQHQRSIHKHENLPLKCDRCVFRTVCKDILVHHMSTQCYNSAKQFTCTQCSFRFMWQENLEAHIRLLHPQQEKSNCDDPSNSNEVNTNAISSASQRLFHCDKCNRKYNRKDRLTAHIKKVHANGATSSKVATSHIDPVTGEKKFKALPGEKKFLCAFCGRAVTSSSNLIIHMRRHTGEKPFKCEYCDMAFPRSSDLSCHRRKHTGEKPHKCTVCDRAFSRSYKLHTHMRVHSGERPYKCTYCDKSFAQSNDLTLHIRRHTGERPYVCGVCGERFIQGTALKNHRTMRGHYEEVEPRRGTILEQF